ncbi:ATP-binding protein [Undibacterium sp. Ji22W]|uniref:ATP-binding protein n=1 Tax=Undibacterium sp. Ji22W TaxID=3413038 RepID=UPI003BF0115E
MQKAQLTTSTSPLQLRRLQRHFVLFLLAIFIPVAAIIWLYQKYTETTVETRLFAEVTANTQHKKLAFEQLIQIATTHVQRLGIQFTDALEKPEFAINDLHWKNLNKLGVRKNGNGELVGTQLDAWWRARFGALYVRQQSDSNPLFQRELAASMTIFPAIRAAHETYPYFQWTSFYSAREDLLAVYPYISEEDLQQTTGSKTKEDILTQIFNAQAKQMLQELGPQNNPQHLQQWTAPYYDSGGKGAMVSLLHPQYVDQKFAGVLGTDITLKMFGEVLKENSHNLGNFIAIDETGKLIADDRGQVESRQTILMLDKVLPKSLYAHLADHRTIPKNRMQHAGNWYWLSMPLRGSQWSLIVYFSAQELNALAASEAGNTLWIVLGLLGLLCLATGLISYYFALPSLKLVDFLVRLSGNPSLTSPPVPKAWVPSFELVAATAQERNAYLQEIALHTENLENTVTLRTREVVAQSELAERARHDIELLSDMGREITASLNISSIEEKLYEHVQKLMVCNTFSVGMLDWNRRIIRFNFAYENGMQIKPYTVSLEQSAPDGAANSPLTSEQANAHCVLSATDVLLTSELQSLLYVPLMLNQQVIGIISIGNQQVYAYQQKDLIILRSLAAYASVAFDNALAYQRLTLSQDKLVEQEKLAALGSIVAGVAHELNTPIGNSLLAASTLSDMTSQTMAAVETGQMRRSALQEYSANAKTACDLLIRNLSTAANLITSFKQIAVDQTSDQRRLFNLSKVTHEVALTLENRLRREEHQLEIRIDENIELDSFPGPYGQVISNLMMNAILHAFDQTRAGKITISCERTRSQNPETGSRIPNSIKLIFSDNGCGIQEQHLSHIFEPFYTTRMGQGGSGLGLHICYNIITAVLGGNIHVESILGSGTRFEICLPLCAP